MPDGLGTLADAFFGGDTNEGTNATVNQLAGVGISYKIPGLTPTSQTRIYGQLVGEDEAGGLPTCNFYLAGIELGTTIAGRTSKLTLERVDTTTERSTNGFCGPNSAYNNGSYSYRNNGVVIGAAIGSQSTSTVLHGQHDLEPWSLNWSIGTYSINKEAFAGQSLSTIAQTGGILTVNASRQFGQTTLTGILAYQGFELDTARQKKGLRLGLVYTTDF